MSSLAGQIAEAAASTGPCFPAPPAVRFGGVDPLGLRQINFDRMDYVFPGVNNVARNVRPFTVAAWAWRQAHQIAEDQGKRVIDAPTLQDFVARIEVIYVWSQFALNRDADLPGTDIFAPLLAASEYWFSGKLWEKRRKERIYSTAISSPINYGPSLRTLGWVKAHESIPGVMIARSASFPALDAFEKLIDDRLDHPAFSKFGPVSVTAREVLAWAKAWRLERPTRAEKSFMREALAGTRASAPRQAGIELMLAASKSTDQLDAALIRRAMCVQRKGYVPQTVDHWKRVQCRQLFRLALESLFYWVRKMLSDGPRSMPYLVRLFTRRAGPGSKAKTAAHWLDEVKTLKGPVAAIEAIEDCIANDGEGLEAAIAAGIAVALLDPALDSDSVERTDRLPIARARHEAQERANLPPTEFVRHILESWVLAQHVYWSVGRGLGDARAQRRPLLRLKIILEDAGWDLTPGAPVRPPQRSGDRLETVLSLAEQCDLLEG